MVDFDRFEVPDAAAALLFFSGFAFTFLEPVPIYDDLLGGLIWPLVFLLVAVGFRKLRGYDGLGLGDVKLMAGIGLWCGLVDTVTVLLAASFSAALALVAITTMRGENPVGTRNSGIAFAPFLCLSAWVVWLVGMTQ